MTQFETGPHGGLLKQVGEFKIELKLNSHFLYTYLLGQKGNSISNREVSCRVMLRHPNQSEVQLAMRRFGDDGFFSESGNIPAASYWICFEVKGETVSARFDDTNLFVRSNTNQDHDTLKSK